MRVVEIIKSLSGSEVEGVQFDLQNNRSKSSDLLKIFLLILKNLRKNKEINHAYLLKETKWKANRIRKNSHLLLEYILDLLSTKDLHRNEKWSLILRYKTISERNLDWLLKRTELQIEATIKQSNIKSAEDLAILYLFYDIKTRKEQDIDETVSDFNKKNIAFEELADIHNLNKKIDQIDLDSLNIDQEKLQIEQDESQNIVSIILTKVLDVYSGNNSMDAIVEIITLIKTHGNLPDYFKVNALKRCVNYCIIQSNKGQAEFLQIGFEVYKTILNETLFLPPFSDYRNIVFIASRVGQFKWALEFVEKYKSILPEDEQQSAYSFTKARIYSNMKDWDLVIETLRDVEYKDTTYNLNSKLLMTVAYYELEEYDVLDSFIKAFKVFLRRRRNISISRKTAFYDFIAVVDHLVKAEENSDHKRVAKAYDTLEGNESIPNQDWLLEKIHEVEKKLGTTKAAIDRAFR